MVNWVCTFPMCWKEQLKQYEYNKDWDAAISLMQVIIDDTPDELDSYLCMNYLLMDILVNEMYDNSKHGYYADLLKNIFLNHIVDFRIIQNIFFTSDLSLLCLNGTLA